MKYCVYAIRDNLMGFSAPMVAENDPVAIRSMEQAFRMPESLYQVRPQEFDLYYIGSYDTENGKIESDMPRLICNCNEFVPKKGIK